MPSKQLDELIHSLPAGTIPEQLFPHEQMPSMRKAFDEIMLSQHPLPPSITQQNVDAAGVPCTWFHSVQSRRDCVLLYIHGGGFMWGSPRTHANLIARIVLASDVQALAVDYRETPEHVFPAALDDCAKAYQWLLDAGFPAQKIVLVGDSAGGGLVLSILVRLLASHRPLPAAAVTSSAFTDLTLAGDSMHSAEDPLCTRSGLKFLGETYAAGAELTQPELSPLYADYHGMPPLLMQVGERELLLDDTRRVVAKARAAGVEATEEVYAGAIHLWHWFGPEVPESIEAVNSIANFVRKYLLA